ncbi:MAG TPA: DUF1707 domain-containing protein [Kribbella sp.]|uniref:DUF1707 SHOCT-like domain-containing protein n=1 Tax=Kribbella sp. TaxID=1871183 RepID=UPI002D7A15BF|nr:DUF1707 domain-containing protein [Kribbella sp.]HET6295403.1 DUF1707 domain-containing protein [Kribbella sp.]
MAQDEVPQQSNDSSHVPAQPSGDELALRRRVSDLERENVAEVLREAAGEGRLSYTELEDRLESVYGAKTYGELIEVSSDLPNGLTLPTQYGQQEPAQYGNQQYGIQPAPQYGGAVVEVGPTINVFLSDTKRIGGWLAPRRQEVHAVLGDVTLDYTEAQIPFDEVYLDVRCILADVKIRVPQNAIVHLEGNPVLGSISEQEAGFGGVVEPATAPPKTFHIRANAVLGDIKIRRGPRLSKRLRLT